MNENIISLFLIFGFIPALIIVPIIVLVFRLFRPAHTKPDALLQNALERAETKVDQMEERITQLEHILDEDIPGWRVRLKRSSSR